MDDTILAAENLTVVKGKHKILDNVSFTLKRGETLSVIGPNGAGKTTLFRAILGLIPYEGKVIWGEGVKKGYVPQKLYIDNDLPVTTLEFFSLKEKNIKKLTDILKAVGIRGDSDTEDGNIFEQILQNKLANLSGGELQRVLIAWSLLGDPDVLLFDEPTAGVDIVGEETIYMLLDKIKKERGLTIMLISHEIEVVRKHTDIVLCLNKAMVCYGPPHEVMSKEVIDKLFGEEVHYHKHNHTH